MGRDALWKIAGAALVFGAVFVGLTALGLYLLDSALTDEDEDPGRNDFPKEEKGRAALETPEHLPSDPDSGEPPRGEVAAQIELLGSPKYHVRVEAENRLVRMGDEAVPHLEGAMRHPDPEVRWRAKEAVRRIREGR